MSFGLENVGMLLGLLALAIPLILHLLQRRTFDVVDWGAMQFLRVAPDVRRRWLWDDLLLLLVRMGLLALLVLALATPFLQGPWLEQSPQAPQRNIVVILDGSASMARTSQAGKSSWQRAEQWLRLLLDELGPADRVNVIRAGQPPRALAPDLTDAATARSLVATLAPPSGGADLPQALEQALLQLAGTDDSGANQVYLLRDAQRAGWADEMALAGWERLAAEWSDGTLPALFLVTFPDAADTLNFRVGPVALAQGVVAPGKKVQGSVTVEWTGTGAIPDEAPLAIKVNGEVVGKQTLFPTKMKSPATISFNVAFPKAGSHLLSIELDSRHRDAIGDDDARHLVVEAVERLPVLLVHANDAPDSARSDFFLESVLLDGGNPTPHFKPTSVPIAKLTADMLHDARGPRFRAVVLADVPGWSDVQNAALDGCLARGGSVFVTLGPRSAKHLERYRSLYDEGRGWLPALLTEAEDGAKKETTHILLSGLSHPALAYFADPKHGLHKASFGGWIVAQPHKDASTLAFLDNGQPLLIEKSVGRGRVLLCTAPLDRSWTSDFPAQQAFPVFVERSLLYLAEAGQARIRLSPGEQLRWEGPPEPRLPLTVRWDAPHARTETRVVEALPWDGPEASAPGTYRLSWGLEDHAWFVVPPDERESDPSPATTADTKRVTAFLPFRSVTRPVVDVSAGGTDTMDIWWILLLVVITLLGMEVLLTRRMALQGTP